jgi:predicted secreted hydrolase
MFAAKGVDRCQPVDGIGGLWNAPIVGRIRIRFRRKGTRSIRFPAIIFAVLCVAIPTVSACGGSAGAAPAARVTVHGCRTSVSLPKDEAPHSAPVEWWYFSGHLSGKDAKGHVHTYGYEYVIFQFLGLAPQPVYLGDMAITDLTRKTFKFAGKQDSYPVPKTANRFALRAGSWTMSGGSGRDTLKAGIPGYSLDLGLRTSEPAVLEGNKCGYISLASLGSSYYYSWTSLGTTGTIMDHGVTLKVTGKSWMDHQWGPMNLTSGGGWDWFSMQLSNGQQYMLFFIKNKKGQIVETAGTRVAHGGKDITYLTAANIGEKATGSWTSPATHIKYGSGWKIAVPGGQLTVTPDLRNQEVDLVNTQGTVYWEGDVTIKGKIGGATVSGDGYTELLPTGF